MTQKTNKQIAIELNLKERVAKLGTHKEVAKKMELNRQYIRNMIYGDLRVSAPFLEKLEALEKERDYL